MPGHVLSGTLPITATESGTKICASPMPLRINGKIKLWKSETGVVMLPSHQFEIASITKPTAAWSRASTIPRCVKIAVSGVKQRTAAARIMTVAPESVAVKPSELMRYCGKMMIEP